MLQQHLRLMPVGLKLQTQGIQFLRSQSGTFHSAQIVAEMPSIKSIRHIQKSDHSKRESNKNTSSLDHPAKKCSLPQARKGCDGRGYQNRLKRRIPENPTILSRSEHQISELERFRVKGSQQIENSLRSPRPRVKE